MSNSASVTLLHLVRRQGDVMFHFYDGALMAKNGLLSIPADRPEWVRRAWVSGYRLAPDGRALNLWPEVEAEVAKQSAESTGDRVEDSNAGRQPTTKNRVRQG